LPEPALNTPLRKLAENKLIAKNKEDKYAIVKKEVKITVFLEN